MEAPYTLPEDNPKKIYFSIKEVASFIGVEQSNLRYWEKEFAEKLKTRRDSKNRRQYTAKDVKTLRTIYHLLKVKGLSIEAARERLKDKKNDEERLQIVYEKLKKLKEELRGLRNALTLPGEVEEEERRENVFGDSDPEEAATIHWENAPSVTSIQAVTETTEELPEETREEAEETATEIIEETPENQEGKTSAEETETEAEAMADEGNTERKETERPVVTEPILFSEPEFAPSVAKPSAEPEEKEKEEKEEPTTSDRPTPENDPRQLSLF
ncbi:MAG: MerR family transcriptional regulator [Paludibacteraceae bacterium]|nr:MerR family transcriptional regulator [Paludibacteraceae bacterium]